MLMDVGINPRVGAVGAGRTLLQALAARYRDRALALNNVPVDSGLNRVLAALRFHVQVRQMEMKQIKDRCWACCGEQVTMPSRRTVDDETRLVEAEAAT